MKKSNIPTITNTKGTIYGVLAKILGLKYIKENIYKNDKGIKYFLNKYGFHTISQYDSPTVDKAERQIKTLEEKRETLARREKHLDQREKDLLNKKSKRVCINILSDNLLSDKEKVEMIANYLKE